MSTITYETSIWQKLPYFYHIFTRQVGLVKSFQHNCPINNPCDKFAAEVSRQPNEASPLTNELAICEEEWLFKN